MTWSGQQPWYGWKRRPVRSTLVGVTTTLEQTVVRLDPSDPVGLASADLEAGARVEVGGDHLTVRDPVPRGHKLALVDIRAGAELRKYGQPIGLAVRDILAGEHVHEHNLRSLTRAGAAHAVEPPASGAPSAEFQAGAQERTFDGIPRADGRAGTRNYVAIMSSVNCSATVVKRIAAAFSAPGALDE